MIVTVRKIPFRLSLRENRPILVEVNVKNNTVREKKYVIEIDTGNALSLSPSGLARFGEKKTKTLFPGEAELVTFKVYARPITRPGEYTVNLRVHECIGSYDDVVDTREISVRVPVV